MSVISTSARFSARAAAMPAKPPPTIKTRFLPGTAFITGDVSCGNDLVRTVVMDAPTLSGASRPISIGTAGLQAILGPRCGALNDRASSCGGERYALEQHAREDQSDGYGHSNSSIALRGPIASALCTSCAAAPSSAAGGSGESARAGRKFVVNGNRRVNGTRSRDVPLE